MNECYWCGAECRDVFCSTLCYEAFEQQQDEDTAEIWGNFS